MPKAVQVPTCLFLSLARLSAFPAPNPEPGLGDAPKSAVWTCLHSLGVWGPGRSPCKPPWARDCGKATGDSRVTESKVSLSYCDCHSCASVCSSWRDLWPSKGVQEAWGITVLSLEGRSEASPSKGFLPGAEGSCLLTPAKGGCALSQSHSACEGRFAKLCRENSSTTVWILLEIIPGKSGTSQKALINFKFQIMWKIFPEHSEC